MNTNQLKIFATKAREILRRGVLNKLQWLGFDDEGRPVEKDRPQIFQGGTAWRNAVYPESFGQQWLALASHIGRHGLREVVEEGAYTWFNRLMAIRILSKNNLCEPILEYSDTGLPMLVEDARVGRIPEMPAQRRAQLEELIADSSKVNEQFALLISEWCRQNPIINACFGSIDDYVELLLPRDITGPAGFINLLNTTVNLTEEDYRSSELIGWLYQFYISDRKDEVFSKKGKVEAEEIPAATQIFTPNWIVKYMLQNSVLPQLGVTEGEYLVQNEEAPVADRFTSSRLESFKIADLACGSGHILGDAFDLLYNLYIEEGYMPDEAVGYIFRNNLLGIDIDLRAQQLAKFALMLKAAQQDESLAFEPIAPQVLTIPEFVDILATSKYQDENQSYFGPLMHDFFLNSVSADVAKEIEATFDVLKDARSLGSIMKFDISASTRRALAETVKYWASKETSDRPEFVNDFLPAADLILVLTDAYDAIVMNPPYMGGGKMDAVLSKYVKDNYKDGSSDLATVFIEMAPQHLVNGGNYAFIIPPSWMFLSGFESLRRAIVDNYSIQSLLHLSRGVFGADFGSSSAVIKNAPNGDYKGVYFRLVERTFQEFDQKHLRELFEKVLMNHDFKFYFKGYSKDVEAIDYSEQGAKILFSGINQRQYLQIPGIPIGYWLSEDAIRNFKSKPFNKVFFSGHGLLSGHDEDMLRFWHEVNFKLIFFNCSSENEFWASDAIYAPLAKGGDYRKWYGNLFSVVKYTRSTLEYMKRFPKFTLQNSSKYFHEGITWSDITSAQKLGARIIPQGMIFSHRSPTAFLTNDFHLSSLNSFLVSKVVSYYIALINPTISISAGVVNKLPIISENVWDYRLSDDCVSISKSDWDAHETSWDFQQNELLSINESNWLDILNEYCDYWGVEIEPAPPQPTSLKWLLDTYKMKWDTRFMRLHDNEVELNRQFINLYGLQQELTPEVPLNEVTILQQGEIDIEDNQIIWNDYIIIKQLISYIAGCWMGRYRLDRPGLNIAHPNATAEELEPYRYGPDGEIFEIDDDAIIPILPKGSPFDDNLTSRIEDFVRIVWGKEEMADNLNFMEECLGKSIDDYVNKDFWKDHKKMYQNRPIYWLFSSKKGAFKCIVYAHRMTKHTVSLIRSKYLLRFINWMEEKVTAMSAKADKLSTREQRELEKTRAAIAECHEYHNRLQQVAERAIEFDLDDGIPHNHALFGDILTKLK